MKKFKAESGKLLDMMIHSIYTEKEIFLRELISNASDAIDKMYVKSLEDPEISFDREKFSIRLTPNKEQRTLTISDTGIGMNAEELEKNLGTIAHSGTLDFKQADSTRDVSNIIGQFGVGFYSAFMVADRVQVLSRAYGQEKANLWESNGIDGYTIKEAERDRVGTDVILHLRENEEGEDMDAFLEEYTLRSLVERYSNYIRYPIQMEVTHRHKVEEEEEKEADAKEDKEGKKEPKYEEVQELETLNSMQPIWNKTKNELKEEDYINFYQQEHFGFDRPLAWTHVIADGALSYRAILYIPSQRPFDYYSKDYKAGLSLYSRGVKIMDHADELLPDYLAFVKGIVSSDDFSLNISRETLQKDRRLLAISKKLEAKVVEELKKLLRNDREKYETFFGTFGTDLKAGIYQSYGAKKDPLADLLLYSSSQSEKKETLEELLARMEGKDPAISEDTEKEEEKKAPETEDETKEKDDKNESEPKPIYYATGESSRQIDRLPVMDKLKKDGQVVLYLTERIDEFTIKAMRDYKGHPFQSVLSEDFSPENEQEELGEEAQKKEEALFAEMKEILNEEVVDVKRSQRLAEDAVVLVSQGEISIEMEKAFHGQPGAEHMKAQKVLEVNPKHPIFAKMLQMVEDRDKDKLSEYTHLLYEQARLIEGLPLEDPVAFSKKLQKLMEK